MKTLFLEARFGHITVIIYGQIMNWSNSYTDHILSSFCLRWFISTKWYSISVCHKLFLCLTSWIIVLSCFPPILFFPFSFNLVHFPHASRSFTVVSNNIRQKYSFFWFYFESIEFTIFVVTLQVYTYKM